MNITSVGDNGAGRDWLCEHHHTKYVVSYRYEKNCWTAQQLRDDGERQILAGDDAGGILREFLSQIADLLAWPNAEDGADGGCAT